MNNKYMKKLNSDIQFKNNGIFCNAPRKKIKNKKKIQLFQWNSKPFIGQKKVFL